jgi:hypothetical protein
MLRCISGQSWPADYSRKGNVACCITLTMSLYHGCERARPGIPVKPTPTGALPMRYFFNLVRAPDVIMDRVGIDLVDFERARGHVLEALAEVREEHDHLADSWDGWMLAVCNGSGDVVLEINLDKIGRRTSSAPSPQISDQSSTLQDLANALLQALRRSLLKLH